MDSFGRGLKSFLASGDSQYVLVVVFCFWMSFFLPLVGADDCREDDDSNDEPSSLMSLLSLKSST